MEFCQSEKVGTLNLSIRDIPLTSGPTNLPEQSVAHINTDVSNIKYLDTIKHSINRCNTLIHHHFPVHLRGVHKWNTFFSPLPGLHSALFNMYCPTQWVYRNATNVDIWSVWGGAILCR